MHVNLNFEIITDIAVLYWAAVIDLIFLIFLRTYKKTLFVQYMFLQKHIFKAVILFSKFHLHSKAHSCLKN